VGFKYADIWDAIQAVYDFPEKDKTREMFYLMLEALQLFSCKQNDYSTINIAVAGDKGVWVRTTDKWARLFSHYRLGRTLRNESIEDTWMDLAVYALIAILIRRGKWKPTEEELRALGVLHNSEAKEAL